MIGHGVPGLNIRQQHDFPAPVQRIFAALTREIDLWWPQAARLTGPQGRLSLLPELGAALIESGPGGAGAIWGQIDRIEAPVHLALSGTFGVPGAVMGRVWFDLAPLEVDGCRLTLVHQAIGPVSEDRAQQHGRLWRQVLDESLRAHLAGRPV